MKTIYHHLLFFITLVTLTSCSPASAKKYSAEVNVCFTPDQNCTQQIVQQINTAQKRILVQGYAFTASPIAHALLKAKKRGIQVQVLLDKSNFRCERFSYGSYLLRKKIPVWNDYTPNIAHNKIMIIDQSKVITGSFNFTKSAQYYNTENVVFISSAAIAKQYQHNWFRRQSISRKVKQDPCPTRHYYR